MTAFLPCRDTCDRYFRYESDTDNEEYEGDTSGTETDNDPFDEDYFLDVGFGDLMLHDSMELKGDDSTWCSNAHKLSNILNTLPAPADRQRCPAGDISEGDDYDEITRALDIRESSDTESQMLAAELSDGLESDDEFTCKPVAKSDMSEYYLSTNAETGGAETGGEL